MGRTQRIIGMAAPPLLAAAAFTYFAWPYAFHTINLEQLQLFEWTRAYFVETVSLPGGFADYLGRFLTQFCYYPWSGALVIASLLLLICYLVRALCARSTLSSSTPAAT